MAVHLNHNKRGLLYLFCLFVTYGLVKSIVYFAPLFLNHILGDVTKFGEFEYSLNLGQTFSTIFALGLPNAYAYFVYKEKEKNLNVIFHNIYFAVLVVLVICGACIPGVFNKMYFNSVLIGVALSNQLFITTYYKLLGKNLLAIIIDCGVYILLLGFGFLIFKEQLVYRLSTWSLIILGYTILMVLKFHFYNIGNFKSIKKSDWWRVIKYGILIVITLFLTSLLTTSTRVYIEYFTNFSSVGIYSLFIRIASAIIIFHRVVVILLYRKIYGDRHVKLDNYFACLILLAIMGGFMLYWLVPYLATRGVPTFVKANISSGNVFLWSILQAISWSSVAVLELVIYRENILDKYIPLLTAILIIMILVLIGYNHFMLLSTLQILKINVLAVLAIPFGQVLIIKKNSHYYKKTFVAHIVLTAIAIGCLVF